MTPSRHGTDRLARDQYLFPKQKGPAFCRPKDSGLCVLPILCKCARLVPSVEIETFTVPHRIQPHHIRRQTNRTGTNGLT